MQQLQLSLFSCGGTVTPFMPIYHFLSSLLHFQKCLLTVHQGASADSLSISLHLPLILTLLRLYNRKTTPQGTLFIHATMFTESTQRTSWHFKSAIQRGRRPGEFALFWPGSELRHKQHCHDFTFQPIALGPTEA